MKHTFLAATCFLLSCRAFGQSLDTAAHPAERFFRDPSCYVDVQFPNGEKPLTTIQAWSHVRSLYVEARYNYEARQTASLFLGKPFTFGKRHVLELIPMLGYSAGIFTGISTATTAVLEAGWIRGFSQSQYSFSQKSSNGNFFFNWNALVLHVYRPLYLGASNQVFEPNGAEAKVYIAPMVSVKVGHCFIEGFAYNFWEASPMWAIALQYNY